MLGSCCGGRHAVPWDKGPCSGHQGHSCGSGVKPNLGARVEHASMLTAFRRWVWCRNICAVITFVGYGVAANAVRQEASEIHVERPTPGTKVVICRGWHLGRKLLLLLKSLLPVPLPYIRFPCTLCVVLSSVYLFFLLVFEELFV